MYTNVKDILKALEPIVLSNVGRLVSSRQIFDVLTFRSEQDVGRFLREIGLIDTKVRRAQGMFYIMSSYDYYRLCNNLNLDIDFKTLIERHNAWIDQIEKEEGPRTKPPEGHIDLSSRQPIDTSSDDDDQGCSPTP